MAGQAPSRRQVLEGLACAALASGAPGFVRWSFAFAEPTPQHAQHSPAHSAASHLQPFKPQAFTPAQYATVVALAELILPNTAAPHAHVQAHAAAKPAEAGATDAGVAEFIDFMCAHDATLAAKFSAGLAWLEEASGPQTFPAATHAEQIALLERLAYKKNFRPDETVGQEFFALMRRYTMMGFYTTRLGLEALDYPGLRFYAESPSVPANDPLRQLGADA